MIPVLVSTVVIISELSRVTLLKGMGGGTRLIFPGSGVRFMLENVLAWNVLRVQK